MNSITRNAAKMVISVSVRIAEDYIELMSISRKESRPPMIIVDGKPTIYEELSLPELKALQKQHNIILYKHYNKKELVELLKQRGVLSARLYNWAKTSQESYTTMPRASPVGKQRFRNESKGAANSVKSLRKTSPAVRLRIRNILLRPILEGMLDE
jgi:hypothetical protein